MFIRRRLVRVHKDHFLLGAVTVVYSLLFMSVLLLVSVLYIRAIVYIKDSIIGVFILIRDVYIY